MRRSGLWLVGAPAAGRGLPPAFRSSARGGASFGGGGVLRPEQSGTAATRVVANSARRQERRGGAQQTTVDCVLTVKARYERFTGCYLWFESWSFTL